MRWRTFIRPIERPELLGLVLAAPVGLLEAPGGFGKSTMALQAAAQLDVITVRVVVENSIGLIAGVVGGLRRVGVVGLDDVVATPDAFVARVTATARSMLLIVDDVHRGRPEDLEWLAALAACASDRVRLIIAGRRLGEALQRFAVDHGVGIVGTEQFRFRKGETARVVGNLGIVTDADIVGIHAATEGWPAAVAVAGARIARTREGR